MKTNILLIAPSLKNKGGITSVINGYLNYNNEDIKFKYIPSHKEGNALIKILYFVVCYIRCFFTLLFSKVDIVHMHISERASLTRASLLYKLAHLFNKKVILHHHGAEFINFFDSCDIKRQKKIVALLSSVSKNIVLSDRTKNLYESKFNLDNVEYVYNGVKVNSFNPYFKEDKNIVLFLGRIGQRKGTFDLLDAIDNLTTNKNIEFYFCGDGEIEKLEEKVKVIKNKNIKVLRWIQGKEKEDILNRTLINVLPSYHEGLPMTILETMALGIPNISCNVDSIPEAINSSNGILITPGNISDLTNAIEKMIDEEEFRNTCSKNAHDSVLNKFSIDATIERVKTIYLEVLNEKD